MTEKLQFDSDLHFQEYSKLCEQTFSVKRIKHSDIIFLTDKLKNNKLFKIRNLGHSVENRKINLISIGKGKTNILCWSQMHGNESTATMAVFDLFNFFSSSEHLELKNFLLENLTIHFIPMLNPDGAERFIRENALGIDLNRDALNLVSPESKILKNIIFELKPLIGFNLHDQKIYHCAGYSPNPATISFLAPAYNFEKDINDIRKKAMQLIGSVSQTLDKYIPASFAKYDDEFEPRAFGDNIMKWGTGTVLVESGGYKNDPEKQFVRKLNYIILLSSFYYLSTGEYENTSLNLYNQIPENRERLFDLKIKNVFLEKNEQKYLVDLGINRTELTRSSSVKSFYKGTLENVGDLSTFYGYEEFDASGFTLKEAKVSDSILPKTKNEQFELLRSGTMFVKDDNPEKITDNLINSYNCNIPSTEIISENPANFYLINKEKEIGYAVINGFLVDLSSDDVFVHNCIHF
ncbi:MAG: M14 family zinc carboxypeptidase [Rhodothermaceae bacterium]